MVKVTVTIQLRFDAHVACYKLNSSHVTIRTHFLLGTTAVQYSLLLIMNSWRGFTVQNTWVLVFEARSSLLKNSIVGIHLLCIACLP